MRRCGPCSSSGNKTGSAPCKGLVGRVAALAGSARYSPVHSKSACEHNFSTSDRLYITFTLRKDGTLIRVISARDMHRKERTLCEQADQTAAHRYPCYSCYRSGVARVRPILFTRWLSIRADEDEAALDELAQFVFQRGQQRQKVRQFVRHRVQNESSDRKRCRVLLVRKILVYGDECVGVPVKQSAPLITSGSRLTSDASIVTSKAQSTRRPPPGCSRRRRNPMPPTAHPNFGVAQRLAQLLAKRRFAWPCLDMLHRYFIVTDVAIARKPNNGAGFRAQEQTGSCLVDC